MNSDKMLGQATFQFKTDSKKGFTEEGKLRVKLDIIDSLMEVCENSILGPEVVIVELKDFEFVEPIRPLSTLYIDLAEIRMRIVELMQLGAKATNLEDFLKMAKECINPEISS